MKIREKFMEWRKISVFEIAVLGLMVILFLSVWGALKLERVLEKKDIPLFESCQEVSVYPQKVIEKSSKVERIVKSQGPALETRTKEESTAAEKMGAKAVKEELSKPTTPAVPIVPPAILYQTAPEYPLSAVEKGFEGVAILRLLVSKEGNVTEVRLESSSGQNILNQAAMAGVKDWRFAPARRGAEAVEVWFKIPIRFQLKA